MCVCVCICIHIISPLTAVMNRVCLCDLCGTEWQKGRPDQYLNDFPSRCKKKKEGNPIPAVKYDFTASKI